MGRAARLNRERNGFSKPSNNLSTIPTTTTALEAAISIYKATGKRGLLCLPPKGHKIKLPLYAVLEGGELDEATLLLLCFGYDPEKMAIICDFGYRSDGLSCTAVVRKVNIDPLLDSMANRKVLLPADTESCYKTFDDQSLKTKDFKDSDVDTHNYLKKITTRSQIFGLLNNRKFKTYNEFVSFSDIQLKQSCFINSLKGIYSLTNRLPEKPTETHVTDTIFDIHKNRSPVYALDAALLNLFKHTDIPARLDNLQLALKNFILVLPKGQLKSSDGWDVDFVLVTCDHSSKWDFDSPKHYSNSDGRSEFYYNYVYPGNTNIPAVWTEKDNQIGQLLRYAFFNDAGTQSDCGFFGISPTGITYDVDGVPPDLTVANILLQTLLYLQLSKDSINDRTFYYNGTGQKQLTPEVFLKNDSREDYRLISLTENVVVSKEGHNNKSDHSQHASPITHWRRGHWRNQPCGEKLQDSKIIWIQPTLINPT